jgi:molybdopterin/thiamine biosynthesis adenylyltransferase
VSEQHLDLTALIDRRDGRYHRQNLIPWWDQSRLSDARLVVFGVGALGNEVLKLLALAGVGNILAYDMDKVEVSNLNRSILFRRGDEGRYKVDVAKERIPELNPDVRLHGHCANILHGVGLGVFLWADVLIGGLDNRLARVFVNSGAARLDRVWVDGAIEGLDGIVRTFRPSESSCYECTMNQMDRRLLSQRRSCSMLMREADRLGHAPSTAVAGSLIASLQVMEAIKLLHDQPTLKGGGIHLNGLMTDFSRVDYPRREDCLGHERVPDIENLGSKCSEVTLDELLSLAEERFGAGVELDLSREVITELECPECGRSDWMGAVVGVATEKDAECPECGVHRVAQVVTTVRRDDGLDLRKTFGEMGVPDFDLVVVRKGPRGIVSWLFGGDAPTVLGPLRQDLADDGFRSGQRGEEE